MRLVPVIAAALCLPLAFAGEVPRPATAYTIQMAGSAPIELSQFRGKVVALEFLQTTCPHCQQCAKVLSELYSEYGPKGFQPLGVAINPNPDVAGFTRLFATNFPVGTGTHDSALVFLQRSIFEARLTMPQLVFIDKAGTIRAEFKGNDPFFTNEAQNAREWIERLLKEPTAKAKTATAVTSKKRQ